MTETFLRLWEGNVFFRVAYRAARTAYSPLHPPPPGWVRAECPKCGGPVIHNVYTGGGAGETFNPLAFVSVYECWRAFGDPPVCDWAALSKGARE